MPAGTIQNKHRMRARRHLGADDLQMLVHRYGVHDRHDNRSGHPTRGAHRAEQMGRVMAVISHHCRPRADPSPDIGMATFLPDSGLILKPYLNRLPGKACAAQQRLLY